MATRTLPNALPGAIVRPPALRSEPAEPSASPADPPKGPLARQEPNVRRKPRKARRFARVAILAFLALSAAAAWILYASTRNLPAFDTLKDYEPLISTRVFAIDGTEAFEFSRERRTVVPIQEIPDVLKKAVLAAEDARFYQHEGVNYLAVVRCLAKGLLRGGVACGGSTITQQVVKTFLLSTDSRVKRKIKEFVLAPRLEQNLKKDEILYLYLNQIYLGHMRYGVEEASRFYFAKGVKDLNLGEASALAGVIQSPMRWSPVNHPSACKRRQEYVLRRMREEGWITQAQLEAELGRPIHTSPPSSEPSGNWYAEAVRHYLDDKYGRERVETDGLTVQVAMDPRLQRYAEMALESGLHAVDRRQGWRGPLFHLEPSQRDAALPAWRRQLERVDPLPGEVLVWDLGRVNPELIEPGEGQERDVARMARGRPLQVGDTYAGLVVKIDEKTATVDLGNARGGDPPLRGGLGTPLEPGRGHRRAEEDGKRALRGRRGPRAGPPRQAAAGTDRQREEAASALARAEPARRRRPGGRRPPDPRDPGARGRPRLRSPEPVQPGAPGAPPTRQRHEGLRLGSGPRVPQVHPGHRGLRYPRPLPQSLDRQGVEASQLREGFLRRPHAPR